MSTEKVVSQGKLLNKIIIAITLIVFVCLQFSNRMITPTTPVDVMEKAIMFQMGAIWVWRLAGLICLIYSIVLMSKGGKGVKGIGLLVASAAVSFVFSVLGMMLGIIIWILSGISLKQLSDNESEKKFKEKLQQQ